MKKLIMISLILLTFIGISYASDFSIEDVSMKENSAGYIYTRGMIRNLGLLPLKGYVEIDFLNSNQDIVYSMRALVNNNRAIAPGKAAFFTNTIHKDSAPGVQNVKVRFIKK